MKIGSASILRLMFILGAVVDGAIAVSWFLIASGAKIPNILNGYTGAGPDYQLAMYVGAMFMTAWTILLAWGAIKPVERRGLLLITSTLLFLSVMVELMFYGEMLGGVGFVFGVIAEVATRLKVSRSLVYRLVESGQLGCLRIGCGRGTLRFREADLQDYLSACQSGRVVETPILTTRPVLKHIKL